VGMAELPLEPRIARMVLEADKYGCIREIATIAAFLSIRNIFARPKGKESEADGKHIVFKVGASDALTFLKVWRAYEASGFDQQWCYDNFLHPKNLREARDIRSQLISILERSGKKLSSAKDDESVVRSVAAGLIQNLLQHGSRHAYVGVIRESLYDVYIHPGSSVFGYTNPRWVVCTEIVNTSKAFARCVSGVRPEWLPELAPSHFWFGKTILVGLTEDNTEVIAKRPVMQRSKYTADHSEVGNVEIHISLEEAWNIQEVNLHEAQAQGMLRLTFTQEGMYGWDMVARLNGVRYEVPIMPVLKPEQGVEYYCIEGYKHKILTSDPDVLEADPQFQVLDIPNPYTPETEEEKNQGSPTEEMVARLKVAWEA